MSGSKKFDPAVITAQQLVDPNRKWLSVFEAAQYLQCAPNHIRRVIHAGDLRAVRFANSFRIDRADLDQLMMKRKQRIAPYRRGTRPWVTRRHAAERLNPTQKRRKRAAR